MSAPDDPRNVLQGDEEPGPTPRPTLAMLVAKADARAYGTPVDWEAYARELAAALADAEDEIRRWQGHAEQLQATVDDLAEFIGTLPEPTMGRAGASEIANWAKAQAVRRRDHRALHLQREDKKTYTVIGQILAEEQDRTDENGRPLPYTHDAVKAMLRRAKRAEAAGHRRPGRV